jgi:TetR/AcrR family transcriptional regulator
MTEQDHSTEEKIFDAAQKVFIEKGFNGSRMEEIAKEAGINKSLLHYYYRTKEKLFGAIFGKVANLFMPRILTFIESDAPLFEKIEYFIDTYIDLIMKNPYIPNFIISEINRNPEQVGNIIAEATGILKHDTFARFSIIIEDEIKKGTIRPIQPEQLIVNIIGLCIFPFVAKPILQSILFKNDKKLYQEFIQGRKKEVYNFIINSIKA